tara:strand:- start:11110 stop:11469 length:360 start_codon:yes stop_codon:yes gene_type:complete
MSNKNKKEPEHPMTIVQRILILEKIRRVDIIEISKFNKNVLDWYFEKNEKVYDQLDWEYCLFTASMKEIITLAEKLMKAGVLKLQKSGINEAESQTEEIGQQNVSDGIPSQPFAEVPES